jgi:hypothetical protein
MHGFRRQVLAAAGIVAAAAIASTDAARAALPGENGKIALSFTATTASTRLQIAVQ